MTSTRQMTLRALVIGLIGYAFVIVFYAAGDLLAGRSMLHTGLLLAMAFYRHVYDPTLLGGTIPVDEQAMLWHNVMHLSVAVTIGFIVIGLVEDVVRNPTKSRFVVFTFILGFIVTVVMMAFLTGPIRPFLPLWTIVVSNAGAAAVASSVILRWYPGLWGVLSTSVAELEAEAAPVSKKAE